jgi:hypothetical protein
MNTQAQDQERDQMMPAAGLLRFAEPDDIIAIMNDILAERGATIRWKVGLMRTPWSSTATPPLSLEECWIQKWLYAAIECRLIY